MHGYEHIYSGIFLLSFGWGSIIQLKKILKSYKATFEQKAIPNLCCLWLIELLYLWIMCTFRSACVCAHMYVWISECLQIETVNILLSFLILHIPVSEKQQCNKWDQCFLFKLQGLFSLRPTPPLPPTCQQIVAANMHNGSNSSFKLQWCKFGVLSVFLVGLCLLVPRGICETIFRIFYIVAEYLTFLTPDCFYFSFSFWKLDMKCGTDSCVGGANHAAVLPRLCSQVLADKSVSIQWFPVLPLFLPPPPPSHPRFFSCRLQTLDV